MSYAETSYSCWDECQHEGCPGHKMTVSYQSSISFLIIDDGKGGQFGIDTKQLQALAVCLKKLSYHESIRNALNPIIGG